MLLQKSLKALVNEKKIQQIKLWGKIKGTKADYYIAEGVIEAADEDGGAAPEDMEPKGQGVNKFTYWATNSAISTWTQLPDLRPSDILNARAIRCLFTGDLESSIYTNPFYFEKEKVYLRAQIARINQSTQLTAKGIYKLDPENPREVVDNKAEEDEGPPPRPSNKQMASLDMWVHHSVAILQQGRLTHKAPKPGPG